MFWTGLLNHHVDNEDEFDGTDMQSPSIITDLPVLESPDVCTSTMENGATSETDYEAVAAEYLRVMGDRLQAEFGNQLDTMMNGLDWTLARDALLADARRVLANFVSRFSYIWTRVIICHLHTGLHGFIWAE